MMSSSSGGGVNRRTVAIAVIFGVLLFDGLDVQLLGLVAPGLLKDWGVSKTVFSTALAAALVGMAIGSSIGGWIGDRIGRRRALIGSAFIFGCATAATGLAHGVPSLTLLRLISGFGFGAATPNAIALVSERSAPHQRGRVISLFSIGPSAGALLASLAVIALLPTLGWRGTFLLAGSITIILGGLLILLVPQVGASPAQRRAAVPAGERPTLFDRRHRRLTITSWASFFCVAMVAYTTTSWSPVYLAAAGLPQGKAVQGIVWFTAASILTALGVGAWTSRKGRPPSLTVQLVVALLCSCGIAWLAVSNRLSTTAGGETLAMACLFGLGGMIGASMATLYILVAARYDEAIRATGIGAAIAFGRVGAISSVLMTGVLLDLRGDGLFVHGMMIAALLVAIVISRIMVADDRRAVAGLPGASAGVGQGMAQATIP